MVKILMVSLKTGKELSRKAAKFAKQKNLAVFVPIYRDETESEFLEVPLNNFLFNHSAIQPCNVKSLIISV